MDDPAAAHLVESFHIMDGNQDGKVCPSPTQRGRGCQAQHEPRPERQDAKGVCVPSPPRCVYMQVTRAELIKGVRQSKHVADLLKAPASVHAHDGTLDRLIERFLAVDTSKLGTFSFSELCLHLGVKPR